jgi:spoIIIJ-associated protein
MQIAETSGRTVEDAVARALDQLGRRRDQVDVEVIREGSRGFLGIGSGEAVVRVTVRESAAAMSGGRPDRPPRRDDEGEGGDEPRRRRRGRRGGRRRRGAGDPIEGGDEPRAERFDDDEEPRAVDDERNDDVDDDEPPRRDERDERGNPRRGGRGGRASGDRGGRSDRDRGERTERSDRGERTEPTDRGERDDRGERGDRSDRGGRGRDRERGPIQPVAESEQVRVPGTPPGLPTEINPEPEDDVDLFGSTLRDLLLHLGLGETSITARDPETPGDGVGLISQVFDVYGDTDEASDELGVLIGRRGETLNSLQYLLNVLVSRQSNTKQVFSVDIEGYRRRREQTLVEMAREIASEVRATGDVITLEPMPAAERRIVHLALQDEEGVTTESVGRGENRQVEVMPD